MKTQKSLDLFFTVAFLVTLPVSEYKWFTGNLNRKTPFGNFSA